MSDEETFTFRDALVGFFEDAVKIQVWVGGGVNAVVGTIDFVGPEHIVIGWGHESNTIPIDKILCVRPRA